MVMELWQWPASERACGRRRGLAALAWVCGSAFGVAAHLSANGIPFIAWLIGFCVGVDGV